MFDKLKEKIVGDSLAKQAKRKILNEKIEKRAEELMKKHPSLTKEEAVALVREEIREEIRAKESGKERKPSIFSKIIDELGKIADNMAEEYEFDEFGEVKSRKRSGRKGRAKKLSYDEIYEELVGL
jgi:polyhydroxyalkanoate synthesis regulator phasin